MKLFSQMFFATTVVILALTATAKVTALLTGSALLNYADPVLQVPEWYVLLLAAGIEVVVVTALLLQKDATGRCWTVLWLCISFLAYRGLSSFAPAVKRPCPCLGHLPLFGSMSESSASSLAAWCLGYMFIGSCLILLWRTAARAE